jgi:uncharacterized protein
MRAPDASAKRARDSILSCFAVAMIVGSSLAGGISFADPSFPPLTGRVVDDAKVLSPETRDDLEASLARHERATGDQVVVVTLATLKGYPIEQYGYQLGRAWGIGQKGKNNGVLLIVAPNDHRVRIEVGYGLEGKLTDAESRVIIERDILPAFRRGDFDAGVRAGTASILTLLGGDAPDPASHARGGIGWLPKRATSNPLFVVGFAVLGFEALFFFLFSLVRMVSPGRRSERLSDRRSARRDSAAIGPTGRDPRVARDYFSGRYFGGGFDGDGEGGGGFGGGGSFGGGGASGGW